MNRRHFIFGSASTLAFGGALTAFLSREAHAGTLLSAFEDVRGDQYVGGLHLEARQVFGARVPMRAHGCAIDPRDPLRVLFFARRPGTQAFEFDRASNTVTFAASLPCAMRVRWPSWRSSIPAASIRTKLPGRRIARGSSLRTAAFSRIRALIAAS